MIVLQRPLLKIHWEILLAVFQEINLCPIDSETHICPLPTFGKNTSGITVNSTFFVFAGHTSINFNSYALLYDVKRLFIGLNANILVKSDNLVIL